MAQLDPALGGPEKTAEEKARLWYQLARAAEETGDLPRAAAAYGSSLAAQGEGPPSMPARRDLAALTFRLEQWPEAAAAYETLLSTPGGALKRADVLDALERLGVAYMRAGEPAKAIAPLEKAVTLEPRRRAVLEALVEAGEGGGERRRRRSPHAGAAGGDGGSRRRSGSCWSTSRRFTTSGARIRSGRSPRTWRRWRSGPTNGRSCTACSSF